MANLLTPDIVAAIQTHALATYPEESCGIVKDDQYVECVNTAEDPLRGFRIAPSRISALMPVDAIVHSHPDGPDCPSGADMRGQKRTSVPWIIVSSDGLNCSKPFILDPYGVPERLEGRSFRHGVTDCYSLIRDWYRFNRDAVLPDFPRDWEWWHDNEDLYAEGFEYAGFYRLGEDQTLEKGDVFLAQTPRSPVINHGGIYLGNGLGLHHLSADKPYDPSRLSASTPLARWQTYIVYWLRYGGEHGS